MYDAYIAAYLEYAVTIAMVAYARRLFYLLCTYAMLNLRESYADTTYFAAHFTFAERFADCAYQLKYFKYDNGLLTHMCTYYIDLSLP